MKEVIGDIAAFIGELMWEFIRSIPEKIGMIFLVSLLGGPMLLAIYLTGQP